MIFVSAFCTSEVILGMLAEKFTKYMFEKEENL